MKTGSRTVKVPWYTRMSLRWLLCVEKDESSTLGLAGCFLDRTRDFQSFRRKPK